MVPRCPTRSSSFMPIPVSLTVSVCWIFVEFQIDARIEGQRLVRVLGERQVLELVERVGGVRYQFAQKNLRVGVKRMNDQVEQLIDFGLKFSLRHRRFILVAHVGQVADLPRICRIRLAGTRLSWPLEGQLWSVGL